MLNSPSTSLLTILTLYTSLRRSGSEEVVAMEKLRELARQLPPADRQALIKGIEDWERGAGRQVDQRRAEANAGGVDSADDTVLLRRPFPVVTCPNCGKKNDGTQFTCAYCGQRLEPDSLGSSLAAVEPTWFGLYSTLVFTFDGSFEPLELRVGHLLTLGRHTADDRVADVDLSPYQAELLGVSRLHTTLKRQGQSLTLVDMNSTNHTFLNGSKLKDGEVYTLKTGDKLQLGRLGMRVSFKHPT
jgi:FHA domain-containing protein